MIWLATVKFFKDSMFQIIASTAIVGVLVASCLARDHRIASEAATAKVQEIKTASEEKGKEANAKNREVRAAAGKPGAADRLRKDPYGCRDCQ